MNEVLGHFCALITGPGEPPEDKIIEKKTQNI